MTLSKTLKQSLTVLGILGVGILLMNLFGGAALAQSGSFIDTGSDFPGVGGNLRQLVGNIVKFFLGFLGLLAVIMIIYGGFLYVSSAGNQEKIESAKKILLYSIIGIVVIVAAYAIVNTLLKGLGQGTDVGVS